MKNIDLIFNEPLFELSLGTKTAWDRLNNDNTVIDARIGYDLTEDSRISFNLDNLLNKEYLQRPASLGAPRTYSLLYKLKF
jgi:outer membrane receptor protein involved in Fe transport